MNRLECPMRPHVTWPLSKPLGSSPTTLSAIHSVPATRPFCFPKITPILFPTSGPFAHAVSSASATSFAQILLWIYSSHDSGHCSTFSREGSLIFPHKMSPNPHLLVSIPLLSFAFLESTLQDSKLYHRFMHLLVYYPSHVNRDFVILKH